MSAVCGVTIALGCLLLRLGRRHPLQNGRHLLPSRRSSRIARSWLDKDLGAELFNHSLTRF